MRPPMLRSPERAITVGESGTVSGDSGGGFWKGVAVGAGGLMVLGLGVSIINASVEHDIAIQNAADERRGRELRERAGNRRIDRQKLLGGHERY